MDQSSLTAHTSCTSQLPVILTLLLTFPGSVSMRTNTHSDLERYT